jgi:hypothetical protein
VELPQRRSRFLLLPVRIARLTDAPSLPLLSESFTREAALDGPDGLCRPAEVITATPIERSPQERMFGTSEYLKDGLIGLYERTGDPMVLGRMTRLADAMIADSTMPSRFGDLPARDSETNGNVLQPSPGFTSPRVTLAMARWPGASRTPSRSRCLP